MFSRLKRKFIKEKQNGKLTVTASVKDYSDETFFMQKRLK